jgi:hypothetical protein
MTRDDIIRMAREAGCEIRNGHAYNQFTGSLDQMLARFAAVVAERDEALLRQALEALEAMQSYAAAEKKGLRICDETIAALRERLGTQPPADIADRLARHGIPMPGDTTC